MDQGPATSAGQLSGGIYWLLLAAGIGLMAWGGANMAIAKRAHDDSRRRLLELEQGQPSNVDPGKREALREATSAAWWGLRASAAESFGGLVFLVIAAFVRQHAGNSREQMQLQVRAPRQAQPRMQGQQVGQPTGAPPRRRRLPPPPAGRKLSPGRLLAGAGGFVIMTIFTYFDFQRLAETGHARVWPPIAWLYYMVGPNVTLVIMAAIAVLFACMGVSRLSSEARMDDAEHGDFGHGFDEPEETPPHLRRDRPRAQPDELDGRRAA
jgi:hypothetical protein